MRGRRMSYEDIFGSHRVFASGREAMSVARRRFGKVRVIVLSESKNIPIDFKGRVEFLKKLNKMGIDWVFKTGSGYGSAKIYVSEKDYPIVARMAGYSTLRERVFGMR